MHEMALMGDIIQLVWDDAQEKGFQKIQKIELIVGVLSQAMPDALEMAFLVCKGQYQAIFTEDASISFEIEDALVECQECHHTYVPDQRITICPNCGMPTGNLIRGETFQVKSYEGSKDS